MLNPPGVITEAVEDMFSYGADDSKQAAYMEFERRNREIADRLRAGGLHPEGRSGTG